MKYSLQSCMVVLLDIWEWSTFKCDFMYAFHIGKYPEFLKWFEFGLQVWVCFWLMNSHLWSSKPRSKNCETVELTGDGMCVCLDFWLIWYSGRALFFFLLSSPSQLLVLEPQLCLCLPSRFAEQFQYTPSLQTSVLVIQCRTPNKKTTPPFYILGVRIV